VNRAGYSKATEGDQGRPRATKATRANQRTFAHEPGREVWRVTFLAVATSSGNKKVAKAASAGGGTARKARSQSASFNASVIGICIAGIALVVGSIIGRSVLESAPYAGSTSKKVKAAQKEFQSLTRAKKPDAKKVAAAEKKLNDLISDTHIHAAYGIYRCDVYEAPFDGGSLADPLGIHAHEDGLIHTHPFGRKGAGKNARLSKFFESTKMTMSTKKISWIKNSTATSFNTLDVNKDKCGAKKDKKAVVSVFYWKDAKAQPIRYTGDFGSLKITKDAAYAFVFAPEGTKVPIPPSEKALAAPSDLNAPTPTPTTDSTTKSVTVGENGSTVVVGDNGKVDVKPGTATTVAGKAGVTVAPTSAAPTSAAPTSAAPAATVAATVPASTKKP
jgi:hypothetical protein